jgi:hypothetical protein
MKEDMNDIVGSHDLVWIVLDSLRYDVAEAEMSRGSTPNLATLFPEGWEKRHSPASFTYPAHQAFFAGFLPTPADPQGDHERLFATRFAGSKSTGKRSCILEGSDIVTGLAGKGYHTLCIGGVGFFNKRTPLSKVLPGYFKESHWSPKSGVTSKDSAEVQFTLAAKRLAEIPAETRLFLFINVSAIHHPNRCYLPGKKEDDLETHAAALRHVDQCLPLLTDAIQRRGPAHLIAMSDHGTLYGEDGFSGHRVGHPDVYTVPFAARILKPD